MTDAASMRGSAGVLDLRDRLRSWRWLPAKTTLVPHEQAARHGGWEAILRDGMVVIESRPDPEPDHRFWTVLGTFSKPDLRRLRDLIDEILVATEKPDAATRPEVERLRTVIDQAVEQFCALAEDIQAAGDQKTADRIWNTANEYLELQVRLGR